MEEPNLVDDRENSNKNNSSGSGRNNININADDLSCPLEHIGSLGSNNYIEKRNCMISSNEVYNSEEKSKKLKKKKKR